MTDSEILTHLENNNYAKAMNGLYGLFPSVRKYILANNGSVDDAKDIFQDALVILYKKVQTGLVIYGSLKSYMLSVVKNCWMQELRRRKKIPAGELAADVEDIIKEEPDLHLAKSAFNLLGEKYLLLLT